MVPLKKLIDALGADALSAPAGWDQRTVGGVFASDLISDILVCESEDVLLLTSLLSEQVLRTAEVIGACAVVIVHRRRVPEALVKAAEKQNLPLFLTSAPKFEACVCLGASLEDA
jgi:hypothetical protein